MAVVHLVLQIQPVHLVLQTIKSGAFSLTNGAFTVTNGAFSLTNL